MYELGLPGQGYELLADSEGQISSGRVAESNYNIPGEVFRRRRCIFVCLRLKGHPTAPMAP